MYEKRAREIKEEPHRKVKSTQEEERRSLMLEDTGCCSDRDCGCHLSIFSTPKECPVCGGRLRLIGRSQLLELRLACQNCGYHSSLLSQAELQEIL